MALTREEVQHIATLCRIGITGEELDEMREQLSRILDMFQALQEVDTEGIEPTGHSVSPETVLRGDLPGSSSLREEVLANAPQREGDLFRVRPVLEE